MTPDLNNSTLDTKARSDAADRIVDRLTDAQVLNMEIEEIAALVIGQLYVEPIRPDWDRKYLDTGIVHIAETQMPSVYFSINVPATGWVGMLFRIQPSVANSFTSRGNESVISWSIFGPEEDIATNVEQLDGHIDDWFSKLKDSIDCANRMIEEERVRLIRHISERVAPRRRRMLAISKVATKLNIPIGPAGDETAIPLQTKPVSMAKLDSAVQSGQPEWVLEESIAVDIVETIRSFSRALERTPKTACKIAKENEEAIRDVLLFILNANYRGLATGETFLGNGKTDLLLRWRDRDAFIGECKIWSGRSRLSDAVGQLLGRYTIWRDTRVALIVFIIDRKSPTIIIKEAEQALRDHPLYFRMSDSSDDPQEYVFNSARDPERLLRLTLIPVVLDSTSAVVAS